MNQSNDLLGSQSIQKNIMEMFTIRIKQNEIKEAK
jgi:hypothetical protein